MLIIMNTDYVIRKLDKHTNNGYKFIFNYRDETLIVKLYQSDKNDKLSDVIFEEVVTMKNFMKYTMPQIMLRVINKYFSNRVK